MCPPLFLLPQSAHYNPSKVLLIVMCTLHLNGREHESLSKSMVVRIIEMSLEWTHNIFQTHEWKWSTFPHSEVLPTSIALFISCTCMMCFMVLWGWPSLMSSFMVSYFFENIYRLRISKCFIALFGVTISWYSYFWCAKRYLAWGGCYTYNPICISLCLFY